MKLCTTPLFQAFDRMFKEEMDLYHDIAQGLGLSDSALCVLYAMCQLEDGCLQRDICANCYLSTQTVHSAVRVLEGKGLLRTEPGRGRDRHLYLTPAGAAAAEQTVLPLSQRETAAFTAMSREDQETLVRLTRTYLDLLREKTRDLI